MSTRALGSAGESLAARHLEELGFTILERNYRIRRGEIDLVALDGAVLCFVEVRSRKNARYGAPEETVGVRKQSRIILAAQHYLAHRAKGDPACRFDVVAIEGDRVTLLRDAFRP